QPDRRQGHRRKRIDRCPTMHGSRGARRAFAVRDQASRHADDTTAGLVGDPDRTRRSKPMIPASFDYVRATSLAQAIGLLQKDPDGTKLVAGGHTLIPTLKLRLASPALLVDIGGINELKGIEVGDRIRIGALTTHAELLASEPLRKVLPIFHQTADLIADPQVRNRGTIGGSLANADPAADWPAVVLALKAELELAGPTGRRRVAAKDFFVDIMSTALKPEEVLMAIHIPQPRPGARFRYRKIRHPEARGQRPERHRSWRSTRFFRTPIFSTSSSTVSPCSRNQPSSRPQPLPTVPEPMNSPGINVSSCVICAMISSNENSMPSLIPFERTSPLTRTSILRLYGSPISSGVTIQGPMTLPPSKLLPLAGPSRPSISRRWASRAEKSLKMVKPKM